MDWSHRRKRRVAAAQRHRKSELYNEQAIKVVSFPDRGQRFEHRVAEFVGIFNVLSASFSIEEFVDKFLSPDTCS